MSMRRSWSRSAGGSLRRPSFPASSRVTKRMFDGAILEDDFVGQALGGFDLIFVNVGVSRSIEQ